MHFKSIGIAAALSLFSAAGVQAKTIHFSATLTGSGQTPPVRTSGMGKVNATLDTDSKVFSYSATYSGLTGLAVAAHFHAPADRGANAPPVVPVPVANLASPISGTASMTVSQISDLTAGKWYFNVHTAANPGGEIRGQLSIVP